MNKQSLFFNIVFVTLVSIYAVILAGSIVRATGSGMGCPDWPKCFGKWVPPTEISQLPENYRELFLEKRISKIEKYGSFLKRIGFEPLAEKILNDPELKKEEEFSAVKTWIEYVNRLFGFMAGNFMIVLCLIGLLLFKKDKRLVLLSFITLVLTGIQGWFGSIVVASNLTPWTITFHMLFALLIVSMLVILLSMRYDNKVRINRVEKYLLYLAMGISLFQIYIGTQVRQEIDVFMHSDSLRSDWIENLSVIFEFHRSFAILIIACLSYISYRLFNKFKFSVIFLMLALITEVLSGIIMAYWNVPQAAQPVHLLTATIIFGVINYLILRTTKY